MDDERPETIQLADGIEVQVADDPENVRTIAYGLTVSASEKVSTGDYENYEPHQTLKARFSPAVDLSTPQGRHVVRRRALTLHHDVQKQLGEAVDNKLSDPKFEDWPDDVSGHPQQN